MTKKPDRTQPANMETLAAQVEPKSLNEENRTVDVLWFTGVDVPRIDWSTGQEYMMRFDPKGAMLKRLNNGGPVLDGHQGWEMSKQLGVVDRAWEDDGKYFATLRFSKRPDIDGVWQDLRDRIVQNFSMGVFTLQKKDITPEGAKQRLVLVTKWEPYEISLVPFAADYHTTTLSAEPAPRVVLAAAHLLREIEILRLRQP